MRQSRVEAIDRDTRARCQVTPTTGCAVRQNRLRWAPRTIRATGFAALMLTIASCSLELGGGDEGGGSSGSEFAEGSVEIVAIDERVTAPDISGETLDGDNLALSDFAGKVIVINIWGSWCAPCRAEAPVLKEVSSETRKLGVQFVGVNTRDQEAAARAFERQFDINYPSLVDASGDLQLAFKDSLPPNAIPSTLIIDRTGDVAARILGPTTYSQLSGIVRNVADEE